MKQPPRKKNEQVLNAGAFAWFIYIAIIMAAGTLAVFAYALANGQTVELARTMAFSTIVFFQLFHAFNSRSIRLSLIRIGTLSNRLLWIGVLISALLQIIVVQSNALHAFFETRPLSLEQWLVCLGVASTIVFLAEAYKFVDRARHRRRAPQSI